MEYSFILKGHPNVTSRHRTTMEFTRDPEIGIKADCIVGVGSNVGMKDLPNEMLNAIKDQHTNVTIKLQTENAEDEIHGFGHEELTLDHPTDMVSRKSDFKCSKNILCKNCEFKILCNA